MQVNPIMQMLMSQLQQKNPQEFQTIQNLLNSKSDPQELLKQVMGNTTPEVRENVLKQAQQFGCPENILSQIQNM